MIKEAIAKIQGFGFDVYMRDPNDSYLIFTDGKNLGRLEARPAVGYSLGTIHRPNIKSGTGFSVLREVSSFTKEDLLRCFETHPSWWKGPMPVKYKDIDDYRNADWFNAGYKLVEPVEL